MKVYNYGLTKKQQNPQKKQQNPQKKQNSTKRQGLIFGGAKILNAINKEIRKNSKISFDKIGKSADTLTNSIKTAESSGKKRLKKISKKNNMDEIEDFNKEILKDLKTVNKNVEKMANIINTESIQVKRSKMRNEHIDDICDDLKLKDLSSVFCCIEDDIIDAYKERTNTVNQINKILKEFNKIVKIENNNSLERILDNDKHILDLTIKELQDSKKQINSLKKTIGGTIPVSTLVNRNNVDEMDVIETDVMEITLVEVIDSVKAPPASNPNYNASTINQVTEEISVPQKSLIIKIAETSKSIIVNSTIFLSYIIGSNFLLTILLLTLQNLLTIASFPHAYFAVTGVYFICSAVVFIYNSILIGIQNLRNGISAALGYQPKVIEQITYKVEY